MDCLFGKLCIRLKILIIVNGTFSEGLTKNAQKISDLGQELYKRLSDMGGHLTKVGRNLSQAVDSYNRTVGSFESRVLVSARKFEGLHSAPQNVKLEEMEPIEKQARELQPSDSSP